MRHPVALDRNRTLGLKKLAEIKVPVPRIEEVRWFDRVQAKARALRAARAVAQGDVSALIPAILHSVFKESIDAPV